MRVFVTVGTHNQGFEYLLKQVAFLVAEHELTIQSGSCETVVEGAVLQQAWFTPDAMKQHIENADVVISHLGCGIAREVQELGTPTIFICRQRSRGEHFDDHQDELKEVLKERVGLHFFDEGDDLTTLLKKASQSQPQEPVNKRQLIEALHQWISR